MKMPIRLIFSLASAFCLAFAPASVEADLILSYDSLTVAAGGSSSQLTRLDAQTDTNLVSASNQFSSLGSQVAGGFVHPSQSNVQGSLGGNQRDLNFRFGSSPEVTLANAAVAASLSSGSYIEFGFTAAQSLILDEFSFQLQVNSMNGSTYAARDAGLFVDVDGGGFSQFGSTVESGNGIKAGGVSFADSVTVSGGEVVTYRLAFADKTNTSQNLQSATRIGDVQISAVAVPEASAVLCMGVLLGGLGVVRRRVIG